MDVEFGSREAEEGREGREGREGGERGEEAGSIQSRMYVSLRRDGDDDGDDGDDGERGRRRRKGLLDTNVYCNTPKTMHKAITPARLRRVRLRILNPHTHTHK